MARTVRIDTSLRKHAFIFNGLRCGRHQQEPSFHVPLHHIWPSLENTLRRRLISLGGPLPSEMARSGKAEADSLFLSYAMSLGIDPETEKALLWYGTQSLMY